MPKPVQDALHERYSDDEVRLAERVMRGGTVLYEFQVEHQGKPIEIVFDASGREVKP